MSPSRQRLIRVVGRDLNGIEVCAGVFALVGSHGVPLEQVLENFRHAGRLVDWTDYVKCARADGHNDGTIRARIMSAVGEVFGRQYLEEFVKRLDRCLAKR